MRKFRILPLLLAFAILASCGGCTKKKASSGDEDVTSENTKKTRKTDLFESDNSKETETETEDTSSSTPSDFDILIPDDSAVTALADMYRAEGYAIIAYTDEGKIDKCTTDEYRACVETYYNEYMFSEEFYNEKVQDWSAETMSYDEYISKMTKAYPDQAGLLNKDRKLKKLPKDRVFFIVNESEKQFSEDLTPELLEGALRLGFDQIYKDDRCKEAIKTYCIDSKVDYKAPCVFSITISPISPTGAYVSVTAITMDVSGFYAVTEFLSTTGEAPVHPVSDLTIHAKAVDVINKLESVQKYPIKDQAKAQDLFDALYQFSEKHGKAIENTDPWKDGDLVDLQSVVNFDALIDIVCNDIFDTRFQYLGNGQWIHSNAYGTESFTVEDAEENDRMLRLIYEKAGENAFSGSSYLASVIDGEFTIDRSSPYSGTKISEDQKTANSEAIYTYLSDRSYSITLRIANGQNIYFMENTVVITDAKVEDVPVTQDAYFTETFTDGKKAFTRDDTTDVFYEADPSTITAATLFGKVLDLYDFVEGYPVEFTPADPAAQSQDEAIPGTRFEQLVPAYCEVYRAGDALDRETIYVLLTEDGRIICGWEYGNQGHVIYYYINLTHTDEDLSEMIAHAEEHTPEKTDKAKKDASKSEEEWRTEDLTNRGFFDLMGSVEEGEPYEGSPVVSGYIDYLNTLGPVTMKMWSFYNFRESQEIISFDKDHNFYEYKKVNAHGNYDSYDVTRVLLGDTIYTSTSDGNSRTDKKTEDFPDTDVFYSLPAVLNPMKDPTFKKAYKGILNGEEYIVEEWTLDRITYIFFCRDEKILAIKYSDLDHVKYTYIESFEKKADPDLIKKP